MANDLTREELNQLATEKGVENPESFGTKAELQTAIDNVDSDENHTEDVTDTTDEQENETPEPEQEAEDLGEDAVAPSADHEEGSEADGTADLETPQDAFTSRNEAVELGKETARENIERERAENQVDGE
jgi:hypothetical protein